MDIDHDLFEDLEAIEDIELLSNRNLFRRPRIYRDRSKDFEKYDEKDFFIRYRLSKKSVIFILQKIEHLLEFHNDRNKSVAPINQLLCALRFYATGNQLLSIADLNGISISTCSRIIQRVSNAIIGLRSEFIQFPDTEEEQQIVKEEFYRIARFPNVLGCIDCTHIKIQSPAMLRDFPRLFLQHTVASRRHLAPELVLRLITPACPLWAAPVDQSPFVDPYWGFFWPGGQATARYMLDNRATVCGRRVLDVGCGCGAGAITAALVGATRAVANDIDPYAVLATKINAELNKCIVETSTEVYIGTACDDFDTILIGDMFYDEDFAKILFDWLSKLAAKDKMVLIGDPGRHGLTSRRRSQLQQLARYELPTHCREENHGFTEAAVWRLSCPAT